MVRNPRRGPRMIRQKSKALAILFGFDRLDSRIKSKSVADGKAKKRGALAVLWGHGSNKPARG